MLIECVYNYLYFSFDLYRIALTFISQTELRNESANYEVFQLYENKFNEAIQFAARCRLHKFDVCINLSTLTNQLDTARTMLHKYIQLNDHHSTIYNQPNSHAIQIHLSNSYVKYLFQVCIYLTGLFFPFYLLTTTEF